MTTVSSGQKVIDIPQLCLVVLVGISGSGKSTFARKHFAATEIVSSDVCRGLVSDNENDQTATADAFDVLHYLAGKRLARGKLTVVDATNVQPEARKPLIALAREHHVLPVAIVLDVARDLAAERNAGRSDRTFGEHVLAHQNSQLRRSLRDLQSEGFRQVHVLTAEAAETAIVTRSRLYNDKRNEHGPFDIIGDVHGCFDELVELLTKLGYRVEVSETGQIDVAAPLGRRAIFLGDLVDRGPKVAEVLRLVMHMVGTGQALCVPGNHELKLARKLLGKNVRITHGLAETLTQLEQQPEQFRNDVLAFIDGLISHYVLDDGKLVVAHAGLKEQLQGRTSGYVRSFCLYGETTGETDEFGLPVRYEWSRDYRGEAMVVYGHTPVSEPTWINRTLCIDTGCVYGGQLTALRYPERQLVQVAARRVYYQSAKPFAVHAAHPHDGHTAHDVLDISDVQGKRIIATRYSTPVTIRAEHAAAALEVMSRFGADPHWLIYLPPTMSPSETAPSGPLLEHPRQALEYFRGEGVGKVVCQEKHMGSRCVLIVCRTPAVARARFRAPRERLGVVLTRTGRPFFRDDAVEQALLDRLGKALEAADFWRTFETDWVCLDAELMPWSAKAQELLRDQYAPVGTAAMLSLEAALAALAKAAERPELATPADTRVTTADNGSASGADVLSLHVRYRSRLEHVQRYADAYRRYCWPVDGLEGLRVAPFHLLATERKVHVDRDHLWHMNMLRDICARDPELLTPTAHVTVDLSDESSIARCTEWWQSLTSSGGEGMVVKPLEWIIKGRRGLVQPALKCRGPEYLRIIYGPEYLMPDQLERLRARGLRTKRMLAQREFALGLEGLQRFVDGEPLFRVHECAFGVLALESEPVDPRL